VDGSGTLRVHGGEIRGDETSLPMGDLRPHYVHLRSRVTDTETASGYMALRDAAGHDFETLYFSHGLLRSFNSRVQPAASDETWYEIELVNIDWDRGVYDLCVDGELVLPDVTWNRSRDDTGVARLSLYNESEDVDLWIDDVVVK